MAISLTHRHRGRCNLCALLQVNGVIQSLSSLTPCQITTHKKARIAAGFFVSNLEAKHFQIGTDR